MGIPLNSELFTKLFMFEVKLTSMTSVLAIDVTSFLYRNNKRLTINSKTTKIIAKKIFNKFVYVWPFVKDLIVCFDGNCPALKEKSHFDLNGFKLTDGLIFKNLQKILKKNNYAISAYVSKSNTFGEGELKCKYFNKYSGFEENEDFFQRSIILYSNDNDIFIQSIDTKYQNLYILKFFKNENVPKYFKYKYMFQTMTKWKLVLLFSILGNDYVPRITELDTYKSLNRIRDFCYNFCTYMQDDAPFNKGNLTEFIEKISQFMQEIESNNHNVCEHFLNSAIRMKVAENTNSKLSNSITKQTNLLNEYLHLYIKRYKKNPEAKKYNISNNNYKITLYKPKEYLIVQMFILFWIRNIWYLKYCTSKIGLKENNKFNKFKCVSISVISLGLVEFPWILCSSQNLKLLTSILFKNLNKDNIL